MVQGCQEQIGFPGQLVDKAALHFDYPLLVRSLQNLPVRFLIRLMPVLPVFQLSLLNPSFLVQNEITKIVCGIFIWLCIMKRTIFTKKNKVFPFSGNREDFPLDKNIF